MIHNGWVARHAGFRVHSWYQGSQGVPLGTMDQYVISGVTAQEISQMEQALINDGIPVEDVQRLCDVHAAVFRDELEKAPEPSRVPGHPIHTFLRENRAIERLLDEAVMPAAQALASAAGGEERGSALALVEQINLLMDVDKRYKRKEELVFPFAGRMAAGIRSRGRNRVLPR